MSINLQHKSDTSDWREGLVVLPADHVYGKTALTQQEWRRLAHKRRKEKFVVVLEAGHLTRRVDSLPESWELAMGSFAYGTSVKAGMYHPYSRMRLSVMAETEWQRVQAVPSVIEGGRLP